MRTRQRYYAGGRRARHTRRRPPAPSRRRRRSGGRVRRSATSRRRRRCRTARSPRTRPGRSRSSGRTRAASSRATPGCRWRRPCAPAAAVGGHPHPGAALDASGFQAQLGAHLDHRFLKAPNEIHHIERFGQSDDRIADQLAGPVPGDLAAAVGVDDGRCRRPGARRAACGGPRCTPTGARAAAGCPDRLRRARRRARAAVARPPGSRRCRAAERRSAWSPTGSMPPWLHATPSHVSFGAVAKASASPMVLWWNSKPGALQRRRDRALPAEQALLGELAEQRAQRETGHDQRGRPVHGAAQRGGELGVGDRRRPGQVHRARHVVVR